MSSLRDKLHLFNPELPLDRAKTIPAVWYHDSEVYNSEIKNVFLRSWQLVGRLDQVASPGDFFTENVGGEPVIVVRDREGTLRAFSNVCRHRAARVMTAPCGNAKYLQCRYHGWTYDLGGRLKGAPEFDGVADFFKEENSLPPWKVATFGKLVFVNRDSSTVSLGEHLFPLPDRVSTLGLESLQFVAHKEYTLNCNWKIFIDNYLDGGYHINTLHPSLAGLIDYSTYRNEIARNTVLQLSPLRETPKDPELARMRAGSAAYYWWVYPNLMINIYDGVMDTNMVFPLGPDKCRVVFDFYFSPQTVIEGQSDIQSYLDVAHKIQLEDLGICEEVQSNLESRSYDTGRFSVRREGGGYHFHQLLAADLFEGIGQTKETQ